ncbi:hypothetical protein [Apibacter adventoris]|uniref:hypothetical protein n=1 Tax=Apibacter adventoris TaxID=1679466 RepID=UPI000CF71C58|nr:hypothetical protein [Apibacter adventoris]PQL92374.1 hypothetical protein C4S76_09805 [Apibacter adventoris]
MKTFNQYFSLYKKKYSFEKLFLPQTYSLKESKIILQFCIIILILFVLGDSMLIFNYGTGSIAYILMFAPSIPISIYVFIIKTIQARKELKNNNLPIPIQWYKWKSNELSDIRMTIIYKDYKDISPSILGGLIKITYKLNTLMNL